jgi:mRNA interferase MazF
MRDIHPFLVSSPQIFNNKTSLVIGLPMTTAAYNVDNPLAVPVGKASGRILEKTSYVLCHQPKSFNWRMRDEKPHSLGKLQDDFFLEVCEQLNQIMQLV